MAVGLHGVLAQSFFLITIMIAYGLSARIYSARLTVTETYNPSSCVLC